jgi:predicted aspartyl protease
MIDRREVLLGCASAMALAAMPLRAVAETGKVYRVPVSLSSRRLLVSCTIEGKGPFSLGIDTGAVVSMIRADLAGQLDLKKRGKAPLGIANRHETYTMYEAREVVFGNAFRQERVLLAGLEDAGLGRDVHGMLAAGCLTTMDSELDFSAMQWRLLPDGAPQRTGWFAHEDVIRPTRVGSPHLFGQATLGGEKLRCLLDTGAPGAMILRPKAARNSGMDLDSQNWSPTLMNGQDARVYRSAAPLIIGGITVERPLITVADDAPGFTEDGIVGLPIIKQLNLATEVKAGRLWTRPSGVPADPERYNIAGMWIDEEGKRLVVRRVGRGSPAERAGIMPGDHIEGLEFRDLLRTIGGRPGSQVALKVSRAGAVRDVIFVLEDYL